MISGLLNYCNEICVANNCRSNSPIVRCPVLDPRNALLFTYCQSSLFYWLKKFVPS